MNIMKVKKNKQTNNLLKKRENKGKTLLNYKVVGLWVQKLEIIKIFIYTYTILFLH